MSSPRSVEPTPHPVLSQALAAALLLLAACVTPARETFAPDTPVALYPAAARLAGMELTEVLVVAPQTAASGSFDAQIVRRTAATSGKAVVSIYTKGSHAAQLKLLPLPFGGIPVRIPGEALGSGFFIHRAGYVLSNDHVVRGADRIWALTTDSDDELELELVARDPVYDLALLRVVEPGDGFEVLPMGTSADVGAGEMVIAVGNPLGLGQTVTLGIVSQTGRVFPDRRAEDVEGGRAVSFIQTDAAINPGSSGGPLITLTGAWVGVNTAGAAGSQGIGFTVPSDQVREFLESVLAARGDQVEPKR